MAGCARSAEPGEPAAATAPAHAAEAARTPSRPRMHDHGHDLWVFGYGSLMWRPGFAFAEMRRARVVGHRRSFCLYSSHHRGSPRRPGLVLGLDRGGACEGLAFRVPAAARAATIRYLRAREQISGAYRESFVEVGLLHTAEPEAAALATTGTTRGPIQAGEHVLALAYLIERAHPSYAGDLPLALQARLIRGAEGISGPNLEYLASTVLHLRELGIAEPALERLLAMIGPRIAGARDARELRARAVAMMRAFQRDRAPAPRLRPFLRKRFLYRMQIGAAALG